MNRHAYGTLSVAGASSLWAIDALFRTQLTTTIPTSVIVMIEHAIGFILLLPFLIPHMRVIRALRLRDWGALLLMTVVSSVLGTIFFTQALAQSFASYDFATPLLLQKLQPVFVIVLSALFLREQLTRRFLFLASIALMGSYLISFGFSAPSISFGGKEAVVLLALGAAMCWGSGTILSKYALGKVPFGALAALRFLMAVPIAYGASLILSERYVVSAITPAEWGRFFIIAGVTGGAFAMYWYYHGLRHVPARVATIAELMFPIVSILIAITPLNPYGAPQVLSLGNSIGIVALLWAITMMGLEKRADSPQERA